MEVDSNVSFSTEGWQLILCAFYAPNKIPRFSLINIIHQKQLIVELQVTLNLLTNQLKVFFSVAWSYMP